MFFYITHHIQPNSYQIIEFQNSEKKTDEDIILLLSLIHDQIKEISLQCTSVDFPQNRLREQGGGTKCAFCTIIFQVMENNIKWRKYVSITEGIENQICPLFPDILMATCYKIISTYLPLMIRSYLDDHNADKICHKMGVCTLPQCTLNPT